MAEVVEVLVLLASLKLQVTLETVGMELPVLFLVHLYIMLEVVEVEVEVTLVEAVELVDIYIILHMLLLLKLIP